MCAHYPQHFQLRFAPPHHTFASDPPMARKRKRKRGGGGSNSNNNNANDAQRMLVENLHMQTRILALLEYGEERRQCPRRAVLTPRLDYPADLPILPPPHELPIPPPPPQMFEFPPPCSALQGGEEEEPGAAYLLLMDERFVQLMAETLSTMRQQARASD